MRIVILRTDRLGELLLTLPLATALRRADAAAHVTFVVRDAYCELVQLAPDVQEVLTVPSDGAPLRWRAVRPLIRTLRQKRFDIAIVANPHKWLHWAAWRAGIPRRIGWDRKWAWCLTDRVPDRKMYAARHELEWNQELVKPLGVAASNHGVALVVTETMRREMRRRLTHDGVSWTAPVIALHPWASTAEKRWPLASFEAVAKALATEDRASIIIIGGREHAAETTHCCRDVRGTVNLVGMLSVTELAAVLSQCALLISNDSGPAHVAAAVGTPTITLFGSPHPWQGPARWRPWGEGHTTLHRVPIETIDIRNVLAAARERLRACAA